MAAPPSGRSAAADEPSRARSSGIYACDSPQHKSVCDLRVNGCWELFIHCDLCRTASPGRRLAITAGQSRVDGIEALTWTWLNRSIGPSVRGGQWAARRLAMAVTRRSVAVAARRQSEVDIGDVTLTRLGVLDRLAVEPDPRRRRELFFALEPTWQTIDADGGVASPYLRMLPLSADRWS